MPTGTNFTPASNRPPASSPCCTPPCQAHTHSSADYSQSYFSGLVQKPYITYIRILICLIRVLHAPNNALRCHHTVITRYEHRRAERWTALNYASHYPFSRSKARSQQQAPSHTTKIINQVCCSALPRSVEVLYRAASQCFPAQRRSASPRSVEVLPRAA